MYHNIVKKSINNGKIDGEEKRGNDEIKYEFYDEIDKDRIDLGGIIELNELELE